MTITTDLDCVVLGAGVVGLAIARRLALAGREVLVVEQENGIGNGVSSRNSEVIHAGIYYPPGSIKATSCVAGRDQLYRYCRERQLPHQQTGKLIVAHDAGELKQLHHLQAQAAANGVHDLRLINGDEARELEPELRCHSALLSPSTGIIDSHAYMLSLQGEAENAGAIFVFNTPFLQAAVQDNGSFSLEFGGEASTTLSAHTVINATGLFAPEVAQRFQTIPANTIPIQRYCKGSYFALSGKSPFRHLIYPLPNHSGLGIHLTLDMGGQARFGPDTEWLPDIDYDVDDKRKSSFVTAIQQYWPALQPDKLSASYSGIRPKITEAGEPAADFIISGPDAHGIPNVVHLYGIESPGLTASLYLADMVYQQLSYPKL